MSGAWVCVDLVGRCGKAPPIAIQRLPTQRIWQSCHCNHNALHFSFERVGTRSVTDPHQAHMWARATVA